MKKLVFLMCLISLGGNAQESLFSCNKGPSRVPDTLDVIDLSTVEGHQVVMVVKKNYWEQATYYFGKKVVTDSPIFVLNSLIEYKLVDLSANEFTLEIVESYYSTRACSPRAGNCEFKATKAKLKGLNFNENYTCL